MSQIPLLRRGVRPLRMLLQTLALGIVLMSATVSLAQAIATLVTPWETSAVLRIDQPYQGTFQAFSAGAGNTPPMFFCEGLPPGLTLNPQTGAVTGTPTLRGYFDVKSWVRVGTTRSATLTRRLAVTDPHLPPPGVYEQVLPATVFPPLGAHLSFTFQLNGTWTGTVRSGARTQRLVGGMAPLAPGTASISGGFTISLPGSNSLQAVFISNDGGVPVLQGGVPGLGGFTPITPLLLCQPFSFGQVSRWSDGRHVVAFTPASPAAHGAGFGSVQVAAGGRLNFACHTPEGRGVTGSHQSYFEGPDSRSCLYLYDPQSVSVILGHIVSTQPPGGAPGLTWVRQPLLGRQYRQGIVSSLNFLSSRMELAYFSGVFGNIPLNLELTQGSALASITPFRFTPRYQSVFGPGAANPLKARLDLYAPTGFFSGSFTLRDPDPANLSRTIVRTVHYRGIFLYQHGVGVGHFLVPTLPDPLAQPPTTMATSPIVSGHVLIRPDGKK